MELVAKISHLHVEFLYNFTAGWTFSVNIKVWFDFFYMVLSEWHPPHSFIAVQTAHNPNPMLAIISILSSEDVEFKYFCPLRGQAIWVI